jgi:hypothetical protein
VPGAFVAADAVRRWAVGGLVGVAGASASAPMVLGSPGARRTSIPRGLALVPSDLEGAGRAEDIASLGVQLGLPEAPAGDGADVAIGSPRVEARWAVVGASAESKARP